MIMSIGIKKQKQMKTIEEVREHFKDAEMVEFCNTDVIGNIESCNIIKTDVGCFHAVINGKTSNEDICFCVCTSYGEFAKILTYKNNKMKNYINIEGKQIELTEEQMNLIKESIVESKELLPKTFEGLKKITGYASNINSAVLKVKNIDACRVDTNTFATKEQAEASIALAQLSQLKAVYNDGWVADWEDRTIKYSIYFYNEKITVNLRREHNSFLTFKDKETRNLFLENFKDLIMKAKPLMS